VNCSAASATIVLDLRAAGTIQFGKGWNHLNPDASPFGALVDAMDAERSHLGCKLHDTIIQNLAAISIHLTDLLENTSHGTNNWNTIQECAGLVDESIREMRSMSRRLNPIPVPEVDFAACIETLRELSAADGVSLFADVIALRRVKLSTSSRDVLVRAIWDCARGMAEAGMREIHLGVTPDREFFTVSMTATKTAQRPIAADSLYWWIVQERVGRLGGEVKIGGNGEQEVIEFTIPTKDLSWAAVR
jgi:signal transduction histidine kinase